VSELDDRRQRARETYYDVRNDEGPDAHGIEAAIETATRVRITPEIVMASGLPVGPEWPIKNLTAAFRAAGFEVEE